MSTKRRRVSDPSACCRSLASNAAFTRTTSLSDVVASKVEACEIDKPREIEKPQAFLKWVLHSRGFDAAERPALSMNTGFFHEPTDAQKSSYGNDLIRAVRGRDINALREILKEGEKSLQCCNNFGESLIHMACRRSFTEVVAFLIEEAGVSIRVRDDFGRTPLHDACWTCEPNFELMEMLIVAEPDLLLVSDKRGHAPLEYVRQEHWGSWVKFLDDRKELLSPNELSCKKVVG